MRSFLVYTILSAVVTASSSIASTHYILRRSPGPKDRSPSPPERPRPPPSQIPRPGSPRPGNLRPNSPQPNSPRPDSPRPDSPPLLVPLHPTPPPGNHLSGERGQPRRPSPRPSRIPSAPIAIPGSGPGTGPVLSYGVPAPFAHALPVMEARAQAQAQARSQSQPQSQSQSQTQAQSFGQRQSTPGQSTPADEAARARALIVQQRRSRGIFSDADLNENPADQARDRSLSPESRFMLRTGRLWTPRGRSGH